MSKSPLKSRQVKESPNQSPNSTIQSMYREFFFSKLDISPSQSQDTAADTKGKLNQLYTNLVSDSFVSGKVETSRTERLQTAQDQTRHDHEPIETKAFQSGPQEARDYTPERYTSPEKPERGSFKDVLNEIDKTATNLRGLVTTRQQRMEYVKNKKNVSELPLKKSLVLNKTSISPMKTAGPSLSPMKNAATTRSIMTARTDISQNARDKFEHRKNLVERSKQEGQKRFETRFEEKEQERQAKLLENRLKRLHQEREQLQKKIIQDKNKIFKHEIAKAEYMKKLADAEKRKTLKMLEIEAAHVQIENKKKERIQILENAKFKSFEHKVVAAKQVRQEIKEAVIRKEATTNQNLLKKSLDISASIDKRLSKHKDEFKQTYEKVEDKQQILDQADTYRKQNITEKMKTLASISEALLQEIHEKRRQVTELQDKLKKYSPERKTSATPSKSPSKSGSTAYLLTNRSSTPNISRTVMNFYTPKHR